MSNIIVSNLDDHFIREVRTVVGKAKNVMEKHNSRYDSKKIWSRISMVSELVSMLYNSLRERVDKHIGKSNGIIEQLRSMRSTSDKALSNTPC